MLSWSWPCFDDALLLGAGEHLGRVVAAEALAEPHDAREDFLGEHQRLVDEVELAEAHVAGAAVVAVELLAEVLDERAMPADRSPPQNAAIASSDFEGAGRGVGVALLDEHPPHRRVAAAVQQQAVGLEPVAARAAALLHVVLERLRHAGVNDVADVRLVDAHAEGDGGDDHVGPLFEKRVLIAVPLVVGQAGVVGQGAVAEARQRRGRLVDFLAADAVDDARLAAALLDELAHLAEAVRRAGGRGTRGSAGRTSRRASADRRSPSCSAMSLLDALGGGGRVGVDADAGERLLEHREAAVLGAEVVPPLR